MSSAFSQRLPVFPSASQYLGKLFGANNFISWSPVLSAGSGAFTTISAVARYMLVGALVYIEITVTITTNGTAAGYVGVTLPKFAASNCLIFGRASAVTGKALQGIVPTPSNILQVYNYDGTYPGQNGENLTLNGWYSVQ